MEVVKLDSEAITSTYIVHQTRKALLVNFKTQTGNVDDVLAMRDNRITFYICQLVINYVIEFGNVYQAVFCMTCLEKEGQRCRGWQNRQTTVKSF